MLPSTAFANECFVDGNHLNPSCSQYRYDKITAYFEDNFESEHSVQIKRVYARSSGELLSTDYDFDIKCSQAFNCLDIDLLVTQTFWEFRNAVVQDRLYIYVPNHCNPLFEVCCEDGICTEILGVGDKSYALTEMSTVEPFTSQQTDASRVRQTLSSFDSTTFTVKSLLDTANSAITLKNALVEQSSNHITIGFLPSGGSQYKIVVINKDTHATQITSGSADTIGNASITVKGYTEAMAVKDFLYDFYSSREKVCTKQEVNCRSNGFYQCDVVYRCE